ncbi:hypothetical protein HZF05_02105 [Sphingomonas sp. CGMCC 1.13654]|uniref:Uncharacterized protein n=1 Tax=Sphingomonas chungangi TaxID=2683589 RepID=A0A838L1S5_9SPHN|nr:hypothetical protein [Sphingomonas chungangi]MBA2932880.1 hypothetical protein [Sphingomonas chungangi]MVW56500.1 hypothetical protein [Sphingomonas chungangi]
MNPLRYLGDYAAHPDPLTAACNRIALLVASNQPFYPLYLWWIVGGDWRVACWTFLSTPFFAAVPAMARRNALAGRAMLPLTGIANGILSAKAFGEASDVELFLIPCGLIACLAFRRHEWRIGAVLLAVTVLVGLLHGHYGTPLGRFDASEYAHFLRLNATSVVALSAVILWTLSRARAPSAPR